MSAHGRDTVIDLLLEHSERIEAGLTALDTRLRLEEQVEVDALLRDALGYPVVLLLVRGEVAAELARIAAVFGALQRGRFLLQRLYGERGLDPALRPRFVLLATRFPDDTAALLEMLGGVEVSAFEYRLVGAPGKPLLDLSAFHRSRGPALGASAPPTSRAPQPAAAPAAPAAPAVPARPPASAAPQAPEAARRLFLRARESIRALSSQVVESQREGQVQYRVDDGLLAALVLDRDGFRLRCGEQGAERPVPDEAALNEGLNAVFSLYFNQLAPDRPGT